MLRTLVPLLTLGVLLLLVGCKEEVLPEPPVDSDHTDVVPDDTVCGSWADDLAASCVANGSGCFAQCQGDDHRLALTISCENRLCSLSGVGQGGGTSCTISADDRQDGCGLCETAHRECFGGAP